MAKICIFLINLYRKYISRYTKPRCRFSPTCSSYAVESYQKFGFFLGTYLTVKRLKRIYLNLVERIKNKALYLS